MSLAPGSRLGAYEVLSFIGAGGMGEVYKARDIRLDRTAAIKVLNSRRSEDAMLPITVVVGWSPETPR